MKLGVTFVSFLMAAGIAVTAASQTAKTNSGHHSKSARSHGNTALIARGDYLVNRAGKCGDCHTPMDRTGQPIEAQKLQGAPLPFKPSVPIPGWAGMSMPIAGLPTMASDADAISFFTTGKHLDGHMAAPPMPQYRFNRQDAEAIIAYLKSLKQ